MPEKFVGFIAGAIILSSFSTFQKIVIGVPLLLKGYAVPVILGGLFGLIIGMWNEKLRKSNRDLRKANESIEIKVKERTLELEKALAEIKTLRGILPICSKCKNIRDENGFWKQVDEYISNYTEAELSHSICPECAKKYYPEMNLYEE